MYVSVGAAVNTQDDEGVTPLHLAAWRGHLDLCGLLLDYGADPTCTDQHVSMLFQLINVQNTVE